jgi:DNA polymerase-3 subunit beta
MKIKVESQLLAKNLTVLKKVISSSVSLPILSCFLFKAEKTKLTILATDLDITLEVSIPAESSEEGSFAVSSATFMEMINSLPDQELALIVSEKELEVETNDGSYQMAVDDAKEFPKLPVFDKKESKEIPGHILAKAFSQTLFAAGSDDIRPMLTGVCLDFKTEELVFVSTDANKLSRYSRKDFKSEKEMQIIVPKKPIIVLTSALVGKDVEVKMEFNETNISFEFENTVLICRLIDAKYPNYESVIPKENPNTLEINRAELASSLKRISIFANKNSKQVIIDKKGNMLTLLGEDKDFNNKGVETLTCKGDGNDIKIGFNSKLLSEIISSLSCMQVKISMSQPNRAGIITPVESPDENESIKMLVMPVMIN